MVKHNYLAILVMVIIHMAVGALWYTYLFGDMWAIEAFGKTPAQMQAEMQGDMDPTPFIINIIGVIFLCFFISWLVQRLGNTSFGSGFMTGLYTSLGIVLPIIAIHYAFLMHSTTLIVIDTSMSSLMTMLTGGILAAWRKK